MIIENQGLRISLEQLGKNLQFQVLDQEPKVREFLQLRQLEDNSTGWKLQSNRKPYINTKTSRVFFVRGSQPEHNDRVVVREFETAEKAQEAAEALMRLVSKLGDENAPMNWPDGSITRVRQAIINAEQAKILCLTNKKHWPLQRGWKPSKPYKIDETEKTRFMAEHWNEHLGQAVDVLNKAHDPTFQLSEEDVTNPHKVDHESCKWAVDSLQGLFDQAQLLGAKHVPALWRLISGMRSPDCVETHAHLNRP